ncbi:MAG: UDP-glucuronate 5-epimerase [Geminicoccus sp.]|nr:UDP-glucuronate 5-epimerase [Geminicoccus sp.]
MEPITSKIFVTGAAGFIGFHLVNLFLEVGHQVIGHDGFTSYYDVDLKAERARLLEKHEGFRMTTGSLEDHDSLRAEMLEAAPDVVVHLAAQAGVRYSLEHPRSYLESNMVGTFNVLECARELKVSHLLIASTSSAYGANEKMPFSETDKAEWPLTFYAATKRSAELMAHTYAHLWNIPITVFRFFTVYGSWGRPDMAYFMFTKAITEGRPIDVYNNGEGFRDFTHVSDLCRGIEKLMHAVPSQPDSDRILNYPNDTLSPVAPHRVVNIGNSTPVTLRQFIESIEHALGKKAKKNFLPAQPGDVVGTWADTALLEALTDFKPQIRLSEGIQEFIGWYQQYYA